MPADIVVLGQEIDDLRERFPKLKDDELFVLWFVWAYLTEDPDRAAEALVGGSRDKGVDAVHIDHEADCVAVIQGKYSKVAHGTETRQDVITFADLAGVLLDDAQFSTWERDCAPDARYKMKAARSALRKKDYTRHRHLKNSS